MIPPDTPTIMAWLQVCECANVDHYCDYRGGWDPKTFDFNTFSFPKQFGFLKVFKCWYLKCSCPYFEKHLCEAHCALLCQVQFPSEPFVLCLTRRDIWVKNSTDGGALKFFSNSNHIKYIININPCQENEKFDEEMKYKRSAARLTSLA